MKKLLLIVALALSALEHSRAANLTGDGYIYITQPTTAWTPPNNINGVNRFMWYPDKGAFRFGDSQPYTNHWNPASIGMYSFAGGPHSKASGESSFAFGDGAFAEGSYAISIGFDTYAGNYSLAIGATSLAYSGVVIGGGYTTNYGYALFGGQADYHSIAIGDASATSEWSFALGVSGTATASADYAYALGDYAVAAGFSSFSLGSWSYAGADYSVALGGASTTSQNSVAIGIDTSSARMSGAQASPSAPQTDDPVFMVGKGTPERNALTIYKNGAMHVDGIVRVKPAGDIPMTGYESSPDGVVYP